MTFAKNSAWNYEKKKYLEHQKLGQWVVCSSNPAYYTEDCQISSGHEKHCWTDLLWYSKHSINIPDEAQGCIFSNISSKTPEEWCSQVAHIPLKIFQCTEKRLFHFEICMHNPSCWLGYWVGVWLGRNCEFFSTL